MASTLKVQNIQHTNNTTALNIDTNGRILTPARPSFMARGHLGGTGAYTAAGVQLRCTVVDHNVGSGYNTGDGKFTCPIAGRYVYGFNLGIAYASSGGQVVYPYLRKNGSNIHYGYFQAPSASSYSPISVQTIIDCAAGDYLDVHIAGTGQFYQGLLETMQYAHLYG
tara:strand:- start:2796 stop:3296 length:501 start_codon:yes stop_codon:yes gene_type:complete